MDRKTTFIIAGIVVAALAVFAYLSFKSSTIEMNPPIDPSLSTTTWENTPALPAVTQKTVITAKHAYRNGEHIVAGEIPLPTPCHVLESNATVAEDKRSALIQFVSSIKTGEVCAQTITPARFKVTFKADQKAKLAATLNGQEVTLNLIEAGPNENLDDFELYIKG